MGTKCLLVMDMQEDLCRDARRRHKVDRVIGPIQRAVELFAAAGHLVFYPCLWLPPDDAQFNRFGDRYCIAGSRGAEVITDLMPLKGPVIRKQKHSAFFGTDLDDLLNRAAVSDVYLTGLQTHICIMTTAADASFRGYRPVAIRECVVSTSDDNQTMALDWIAKYVGDVQNLAHVVAELGRD